MNDAPHPALLPTGLYDLLPPEAEIEAELTARLMGVLGAHGYERVKPPLVEFEETLLSGAGAVFMTIFASELFCRRSVRDIVAGIAATAVIAGLYLTWDWLAPASVPSSGTMMMLGFVVTLAGAAAAGVLMQPRLGCAKASQPATNVNFDIPAGACD